MKLFFLLQENVDPLISFLLCKQWTLYSVTPLYKFSYSQLQEYSRQLNLCIAMEKQKSPIVEIEPESGFKVTFSSTTALKTTDQDQPIVLIQVGSAAPIFYLVIQLRMLTLSLFASK